MENDSSTVNTKEELLRVVVEELNLLKSGLENPDIEDGKLFDHIQDTIQVAFDIECDPIFYGLIYLHTITLQGKADEAIGALRKILYEQFEDDNY